MWPRSTTIYTANFLLAPARLVVLHFIHFLRPLPAIEPFTMKYLAIVFTHTHTNKKKSSDNVACAGVAALERNMLYSRLHQRFIHSDCTLSGKESGHGGSPPLHAVDISTYPLLFAWGS